MVDLIIPTNAELNMIAQDLLPRLQDQRPVFTFFPMRDHEASLVLWEQEDNYKGLQQVRGLNGEPPRVTKTGVKRYANQPGAYGEHELVDERELTERRQFGTFAAPVDITDLVMRIQRKLLVRRLDRVESIIWTLVSTGTFSVAGPSGAILHTDSYTTQTFTSGVTWSTAATATPLADFRAVQLKSRGHGVSFGAQATAYMNQVTANRMLSNTNAADIYGRRTAGLGTFNSIGQLNQLLAGDNLPQIEVYDQGYLDDSGTFQPFIANGVVVVVGRRTDGSPIGEYQMTRNANNPNLAPGAYMRVIDRGEDHVPRSIEVHDGHNGGPALTFPSAIVVMTVG